MKPILKLDDCTRWYKWRCYKRFNRSNRLLDQILMVIIHLRRQLQFLLELALYHRSTSYTIGTSDIDFNEADVTYESGILNFLLQALMQMQRLTVTVRRMNIINDHMDNKPIIILSDSDAGVTLYDSLVKAQNHMISNLKQAVAGSKIRTSYSCILQSLILLQCITIGYFFHRHI